MIKVTAMTVIIGLVLMWWADASRHEVAILGIFISAQLAIYGLYKLFSSAWQSETFWGHTMSAFAALFLFLNIIAFDFLLKHGQLRAYFSRLMPGPLLNIIMLASYSTASSSLPP
ncbi:hypothetical protein BC567DRAFT_265325 [Phyllosticta citribraziliensis]